MKTIFAQGTFNAYQERSLQHAMNEVAGFSAQTTVLSHTSMTTLMIYKVY